MPENWTSNEVISSQARMRRLSGSIPTSYTIMKIDSDYYAECNIPGGTEVTAGTNPNTVIQAAIDLLTLGGKIYFRQAVYPLTAALTCPSYLHLDGDSPNRSTGTAGAMLKQTTNNTNILESSGNPSDYVTIENLSLYGRKNDNATDTGVGIYGKFRHSTFRNLCSYRTGSHVVLEDLADTVTCWDNSIENCYLSSSVSHGVKLGLKATDITICNKSHVEYALGTGAAALYIYRSGGHRIYGSVFDTSYYNVLVEGGYMRFFGNNVDQSERHGIYLKGLDGYAVGATNIVCNKISKASKETDNTYSGVYIEGHAAGQAKFISITGGNYFAKAGAGLGQMKHCVEFAGTNEATITLQGNDYRNGWQTSAVGNIAGASTIVVDGQTRTSVSADLSGGATTLVCFHPEEKCQIAKAVLLYTEASSADAGITLEIGKETDRNYYYTGASEVSKSQWYTKTVTLLQDDIAAGDTVTFYSPGGKAGTGEVMLVLDYITSV